MGRWAHFNSQNGQVTVAISRMYQILRWLRQTTGSAVSSTHAVPYACQRSYLLSPRCNGLRQTRAELAYRVPFDVRVIPWRREIFEPHLVRMAGVTHIARRSHSIFASASASSDETLEEPQDTIRDNEERDDSISPHRRDAATAGLPDGRSTEWKKLREFQRTRKVTVVQFRDKAKKAVNRYTFDKAAVQHCFEMLQRGQVEVPSEATPKHGRWLFNRIIVEGYKPTVAHFNTLLRVIEKHPIRSFALDEFLNMMSYCDARPDIATWSSLVNIAVALAGSEGGLWVLKVMWSRVVGQKLVCKLLEPIAAAYYAEYPNRGPKDLAADLARPEWDLAALLDNDGWLAMLRPHALERGPSATLRALTDLYSSKHITTVDREHLRILLRCFLKNGADLKEVDEVLAECESRYNVTFDEGMLITLLMLCAQRGAYAAAEEYIAEAERRGVQMEPLAWSLLINAYGSGDAPNAGLKRLALLRKEGRNVAINTQTFLKLVRSHARDGNVAKVKELLATMKREYNVAPRRWETVALIEAYCAAGDVQSAAHHLSAMTSWSKEDAVMVATSHVTKAAARLGNQAVLEWVFNELPQIDKRVHINLALCTQALQKCVAYGHTALTKWVAVAIKDRGLPLDSYVYLALLDAMQGKVEEVTIMLELMKQADVKHTVHTLTRLIQVMGRQDKALIVGLLMKMQTLRVSPSPKTDMAVIEAYLWHHDFVEARRYFTSLTREQGGRLDVALYGPFIASYSRLGHVRGVQAILEDVKARGMSIPPSFFDELVWAHSMLGDAEGAEAVRNSFLVANKNRVSMHNAMLTAYAVRGDLDGARAVAADLQRCGIRGNVNTVHSAAKLIAHGYVVSVVAGLIRPTVQAIGVPAYDALLGACAAKGDVEGVRFLMADMASNGLMPEVSTYTKQLKAYFVAGNVEAGMALLSKLCNGEIGACKPDGRMYATCFAALSDMGELSGAQQVLDMWRESEADAGLVPVKAYIPFVRACGRSGARDSVTKVQAAVVDGLQRAGGLRRTVLSLCSAQDGEDDAHGGGARLAPEAVFQSWYIEGALEHALKYDEGSASSSEEQSTGLSYSSNLRFKNVSAALDDALSNFSRKSVIHAASEVVLRHVQSEQVAGGAALVACMAGKLCANAQRGGNPKVLQLLVGSLAEAVARDQRSVPGSVTRDDIGIELDKARAAEAALGIADTIMMELSKAGLIRDDDVSDRGTEPRKDEMVPRGVVLGRRKAFAIVVNAMKAI